MNMGGNLRFLNQILVRHNSLVIATIKIYAIGETFSEIVGNLKRKSSALNSMISLHNTCDVGQSP